MTDVLVYVSMGLGAFLGGWFGSTLYLRRFRRIEKRLAELERGVFFPSSGLPGHPSPNPN